MIDDATVDFLHGLTDYISTAREKLQKLRYGAPLDPDEFNRVGSLDLTLAVAQTGISRLIDE